MKFPFEILKVLLLPTEFSANNGEAIVKVILVKINKLNNLKLISKTISFPIIIVRFLEYI